MIWAYPNNSNLNSLFLLQKRVIRSCTNSKLWLAHTDPLFSSLSTLKVHDIYKLQLVSFMFQFHHDLLLPGLLNDNFFSTLILTPISMIPGMPMILSSHQLTLSLLAIPLNPKDLYFGIIYRFCCTILLHLHHSNPAWKRKKNHISCYYTSDLLFVFFFSSRGYCTSYPKISMFCALSQINAFFKNNTCIL